jgi:hypothetical protein
VSKGTLTNSGSTYTLSISGFTGGGTLNVAVAKSGFDIGGSPKTATIYYAIPVTFNSVSADGSSTQATTQLTLAFSQAITGLTTNDITLSGVSGVTGGTLSEPTGTGPVTYTMSVSGQTSNGTLTVKIEDKSGYAISGVSRTVTIHYIPPTVGIVIDLAEINEWELTEQSTQATPNVNKIFTVTGTYTTCRWYLDGTSVGTTSSYTFNRPASVYQLVVVVTDGTGESRSGRCRITVSN